MKVGGHGPSRSFNSTRRRRSHYQNSHSVSRRNKRGFDALRLSSSHWVFSPSSPPSGVYSPTPRARVSRHSVAGRFSAARAVRNETICEPRTAIPNSRAFFIVRGRCAVLCRRKQSRETKRFSEQRWIIATADNRYTLSCFGRTRHDTFGWFAPRTLPCTPRVAVLTILSAVRRAPRRRQRNARGGGGRADEMPRKTETERLNGIRLFNSDRRPPSSPRSTGSFVTVIVLEHPVGVSTAGR